MAIIGKIRDKSGLIVFIVGLGLLLFIIPFDRIIQQFSGGGEQPLGEINGKPIYDTEWKFSERDQRERDNYRYQYGDDVAFSTQDLMQIEANVWDQMITDTLVNTEMRSLGLQVGKKEMNDILIFGDNPSEIVKKQFSYDTSGTGEEVFVKDSLITFFNKWNAQKATMQGAQKAQMEQNMYYGLEVPVKASRLREKYLGMMKYGIVSTTKEAERAFIEKNASKNVKYVYKEANTIPDSLVSTTEKDVKAYYNQHKNDRKWRQEDDYRGFDYVLFDIEPSAKDIEELTSIMGDIKLTFAGTLNDTAFVKANAATAIGANQQDPSALDVLPAQPFQTGFAQFGDELDQQIANGEKGEVFGPVAYNNNKKLVLVKVIASQSKYETEVRHILINADESLPSNEFSAKKKTADSIANALKGDPSKFALLATQFSEDPGFASNKGYYKASEDAGLVDEFKRFALDNPIGTIGVVKTQFGFHIMEVTARGDFKYNQIAVVDKEIMPSKATRQVVIDELGYSFYKEVKENGKSFGAVAESFGVDIEEMERIALSRPAFTGLDYNQEIVAWAFNHDVGHLSEPNIIGGNKIFIGQLTYAAERGAPSFEAVKEPMEEEVLREKKVDYLAARIAGTLSLEEAAEKLTNVIVDEAKVTLDMMAFPGKTQDPVAVASVFLQTDGVLSGPITTETGVYMMVTSEGLVNPLPADLSAEKESINTAYQTQVDERTLIALMRAADVKDFRMRRKITALEE